MKRLIVIFLLLFVAVALGYFLHHEPGYVLIAYSDWRIETSLWIALFLLVVTFFILHVFLRIFRQASRIGERLQLWQAQKRLNEAHYLSNIGYTEYLEGQWQSAENNLVKAARHHQHPLINYLIAAKSAQQRGESKLRDFYLHVANDVNPKAEIAIGITQASLFIQAEQWQQAREVLLRLQSIAPKHNTVLRLLYQTQLQLAEWRALLELMPALRKQSVLGKQELQSLEHKCFEALMLQDPAATWPELPSALQHETTLLLPYIDYLLTNHRDTEATTLIERELKRQWRSSLLERYASVACSEHAQQLLTAEKWLSKHPKDPDLLLCLGRLSAREHFWNKAKDYLLQSLNLYDSRTTHIALAEVLETLGEKDAALMHYRLAH